MEYVPPNLKMLRLKREWSEPVTPSPGAIAQPATTPPLSQHGHILLPTITFEAKLWAGACAPECTSP